MTFDPLNPMQTDAFHDSAEYSYAWFPSREFGAYYAWVQCVTPDIQFRTPPAEILLENARLSIYRGASKLETLYRLVFESSPKRFLNRPQGHPFDLFWSYGTEGGTSKIVDYPYRDRYISVTCWVDKRSYLAVLRQQHYALSFSFWSR
jgi:hypothetical protein